MSVAEIKVICISHKKYTLKDEELLKLATNNKFRYKFISLVLYNKKTFGKEDLTQLPPKFFSKESKEPKKPMPFTLYELGIPIAILRSYMGSRSIEKEDLTSAKKAFKKLKDYVSQCHERIIADLVCEAILENIKEESEDKDIVFFVEKSVSDKMLGRLASLYLNLDKVTICFLSSEPTDLMTTVMSSQTGKLHFDLHRLMTTDVSEPIGPYPGDSEDSLIQTYFYKPPSSEGEKYRPIRLDIFAQGLLRDKVEEKKDKIIRVLRPKSPDAFASGDAEPRLLIPVGFKELKEALERQEEDIKDILLQIEGERNND